MSKAEPGRGRLAGSGEPESESSPPLQGGRRECHQKGGRRRPRATVARHWFHRVGFPCCVAPVTPCRKATPPPRIQLRVGLALTSECTVSTTRVAGRGEPSRALVLRPPTRNPRPPTSERTQWLVDEMYEQYQKDPGSVGPELEEVLPGNGTTGQTVRRVPPATAGPQPGAEPKAAARSCTEGAREARRGQAGRGQAAEEKPRSRIRETRGRSRGSPGRPRSPSRGPPRPPPSPPPVPPGPWPRTRVPRLRPPPATSRR